MIKKNTLKEFEKMFDITPSVKDDDTQSEEYAHSNDSKDPFDKLVSEVHDNIKEISDKGFILEVKEKVVEDPHDIIKDVALKEPKEEQLGFDKVEEPKEEPKEDDAMLSAFMEDDFDTLPEMEIEKIEEKIEEEPKEEVKELSGEIREVIADISEFHNDIKDKEEDEDSVLDEIKVGSCAMTENDKIKWSFTSTSTMYDTFYQQKKRVIDSCLVGGQVEYSLWTKELEEASVNVVTEVFDQQVIIRQMEEIQQFRNRVKYIGVRVNNQYFLFDRFTPLLRGCLARIQYLKPLLKQDGLVLEHMGDVEMYFERLRGLHKSVADSERNLAAAYEMLSRKVTICMELPPAERYSKPEEKKYRLQQEHIEYKVPEHIKDFDDLPDNASAGPKEHKIGVVGWDSL